MAREIAAYFVDVVAVAGTAGMTLAIAGFLRFEDLFAKIHSASTVSIFGLLILAASVGSLDAAMIVRAAVVGGFVLLSTPIGAHAVARAAHRRRAAADP